jgi:hypothetical protein
MSGSIASYFYYTLRGLLRCSFISLNKGCIMLADLAVITLTVLIVGLFMWAAYNTGYREGHGDGYLARAQYS